MDWLSHLQVLWDYLRLNQPVEQADVILGFGCYDDAVARRAARLWLDGFAPRIVFTGGLGRNTTGLFDRSEAEVFADVACSLGVPREAIALECRSANTKENILFTRALLEQQDIPHSRILGVHKPYMERRIFAAMENYWPEQHFRVTSLPQSLSQALEESQRQGMQLHSTVSTIVGDFQRIEVYARLGYQTPQEIPPSAWEAFHALVEMGYDSHLVR